MNSTSKMIEVNNNFVICRYIKSTLFIVLLLLSCFYMIKEISISNGKNLTLAFNIQENITLKNASDFDDMNIDPYNVSTYINNKTKHFLINLVRNATKYCKTF